jgi:hypothetical protein
VTSSIRSNTFGGVGGVSFEDSHDIDAWGSINQIVVRHGAEVDSIGVAYANGNYVNHGGTGGTETKIDLGPGEYISRVEGRSGSRLDQITFHSNKGTYGPFGGGGGAPFNIDLSGKELHYLFGRAGSEIDQIGFAYGDPPPALPATIQRSIGHGGTGGDAFDDLSDSGTLLGKIASITVRSGSLVDSITVQYGDKPGKARGGSGGREDTFNLDDNEWLTELRGRSGSELDQVQFVLSSGRISPVYGGNGGQAFTERRYNSVIKAFFGRSGSLVDQLGVYFEDAKPVAIDITAINYDLSRFDIMAMPPLAMEKVFLDNRTSTPQQVTQAVTVKVTDSTTTSITETHEVSTSFTVEVNAEITKESLTVGCKQGESGMTGQSHSEERDYTVTFQATVPANSTITGTCVARQSTYNVPWTATGQVTYQDRQPQTMTLHGMLKGVQTTSVEAEYEPAEPIASIYTGGTRRVATATDAIGPRS